jgi:TonB family protein
MFAELLAIVLAGAPAQAASAPAQGLPAAATAPPPPAETSTVASEEELKRLRAELPKVTKSAELLNAREVASAMDYPKEAIANGQQGSVDVWLLIAADGSVQRCGIRQSSGSAALDTQTCDLFVANAEFRPARGKGVRPVASIHEQRLVWRLEGDGVIVRNQIAKDNLFVGPDGEVRSCRPEFRVAADQWIEGSKERCAPFAERAQVLLLAAREQSKLHDAHVVLEERAFTDASEEMPPVGTDPGDILVYLRRATMSFDPSGKRTSCTKGESFGAVDFRAEPCADPTFYQLPPNMMRAGVAAENVRFLWAIYLKNEPK